MEEKQTTFQNNDINIYGVLNSSNHNKLIIFVHGIYGSKDEEIILYESAKFFPEKGFDTYRFDLYSGSGGARMLEKSSIANHVSDLDVVIENFKDKYSEIYLIGHSLAGAVILSSQKLNIIKKIVLWDPSLYLTELQKQYTYQADLDLYYKHTNMLKFISKEMHNEFGNIDNIDLINNVQTPTKIIFAEEARWYKIHNQRNEIQNDLIEITSVAGATHCFVEIGVVEKLLSESLGFILD